MYKFQSIARNGNGSNTGSPCLTMVIGTGIAVAKQCHHDVTWLCCLLMAILAIPSYC